MKLKKIVKELDIKIPQTFQDIRPHFTAEQVVQALESALKTIAKQVEDLKIKENSPDFNDRIADLGQQLFGLGIDLKKWRERFTHGDYPGQITQGGK